METTITNFEITLIAQDPLWFKDLINHLIGKGCFPFSWEMRHLETYPEYHLTIEANCTNVLIDLLKLLPDYEAS